MLQSVLQRLQEEKRPILVYLAVGASNTLLYIGLFSLFFKLFKIDYRVSVTISFMLASVFHFLANRKCTFASNGRIILQLPKYITMVAFNYFLSISIIIFCVDFLSIPHMLAVTFTAGFTIVASFVIFKIWVFKDKRDSFLG